MDHPVLVLFGILTALALGAISPGPSFLFVMRTSVALSRRDGLAAAAGMGIGAAFVSTLALVGVRALIAQVGWLYIGFKLLGGAYLVYLAWRLWRGAAPAPVAAPEGGRAVMTAIGTDMDIKRVTLLGSNAPLRFERSGEGLALSLPASVPDQPASVYRIEI